MAFRLGKSTNNNVRAKSTDAVVDAIDAGGSAGRIEIRTGSQPATPETAATGTLLVSIPFARPAFSNSDVDGTAILAGGAISATVTSSGTAGWFRVLDSANNSLFDGSIAQSPDAGNAGDMDFDNINFVTGGTATINSMSIQTPM
jgi:hypothetical protein